MASASPPSAFAKSSGREAGTKSLLRIRKSPALRRRVSFTGSPTAPRLAQPLDLLVGVAEAGEDLPGVLSEAPAR